MNALAQLGLKPSHVRETIRRLRIADYVEGPANDRNERWRSAKPDIWVFGAKVQGKEVYIKLKIEEDLPEPLLLCLSFHPSRFKLTYPYRKGGT